MKRSIRIHMVSGIFSGRGAHSPAPRRSTMARHQSLRARFSPGVAALMTLGFLSSSAGAFSLVTATPAHAATPTLPSTTPLAFEDADGNMACDGTGGGAGCTGTTPNYLDWESPYVTGSSNFLNEPDTDPQCTGGKDEIFSSGSKENDTNVTVACTSSPPKVNLTQAYAWHQTIGSDTYLYLAWEAPTQSGGNNNHIDFELNQAAQTAPPTGGGAWTINRTKGDLLFDFDITPSAAEVCYSVWDPTLNSGAGAWGTSLITSPTFDANCTSSNGEAVLNGAQAAVAAAAFTDTINSAAIPAGGFGEMGIDLTTAGLFTPGSCTNFANLWVKGRSSGSGGTSELKSFIPPVSNPLSDCQLTTQLSTGTATVGVTGVTDQATLTGATPAPPATVTYNVYSGNGTAVCTGTPVFTDTEAVTSGGVIPPSKAFTPSSAGSYEWQATFNQNGTTPSVKSACGSEPLTAIAPTLTLTKTSTDTSAVNAGSTINYTVTVTNTSTQATAVGVTVSDTLPTNGGLNWSISSQSPASSWTISGGKLTFGPATLAPGASATVTISSPTTQATCGTVSNSATSSSSNGNSPSAGPVTITVNCPTATTTNLSASSISVGDSAHDSATVTGASTSAGGTVTFNVYTDTGCSSLATTGTGGQISGQPTTTSQTNTAGTISATSSNVTFNTAGTYYWQASYSGDPATNTGSSKSACTEETILVNAPHLTLTKTTTDTSPVSAGSTINYTVTISNTATNATAHGVTVSDTVPTNSGLNWTISTQSGGWTLSGGTLSFGPADLAPGGSATVTVTSPTTTATCGTVSNSATSNSSNDGHPSVGPVSISVDCPTSVSTGLSASAISVGDSASDTANISGAAPTAGGTLTYAVYTNNTCSTLATTGTGGQISAQPGTVTVVDGVAPGSNSVTFNAAGTYYWQASYSGDPSTNTGSSKSACTSETLAVGAPNLVLTKTTTDTSPVNAGATINYTLTISNTVSNATAHGVTVTDVVPANTGLNWTISTQSGGWTLSGGTLSFGPADIGPSSSATVTITSPTTTATCGTVSNSASSTSSNDGHPSVGPVTISVDCPTATNTNLSASSVSVGDTAHDSATVTGASPAAGGTVTFNVYTDTSCTSLATTGSGGQISGQPTTTSDTNTAGTISATSSNVTFNTAGTYYWQASYSGDPSTNTGSSKSPCTSETLAVNAPHLTLTKTTTETSPVNAGSTIDYTLTITNTATNATAHNVTVSDIVPTTSGLAWTIGSQSGGWTLSGGTLSFGPADLGPGASATVTITSPTTTATCGTVSNSATSTSSNGNSPAVGPVSITVDCPTSVSTSLSATSITVGGSASDTATISGAAPTAGGTITYSVYTDSECSSLATTGTGGDISAQPGTFDVADGVAPGSNSVTFNNAGTYYWQASYSGDPSTNTGSSKSPCTSEILTVTKASPTITTVAAPVSGTTGASETVGDTATFHSTVSVAPPTGSVTFSLYAAGCDGSALASGSGTISTTGGVSTASFSTSWTPGPPGTYDWVASYAGDANNNGFITGCGDANEEVTVTQPVLSASKASAPASGSTVPLGTLVTYTVTLINTGSGAASDVTLTDPVPAGTTYVAGSATCGGEATCLASEAGGIVTWTGLAVAAATDGMAGSLPLTFQVTVNSDDTNGQVIPNTATFTNVNTPNCSALTCPTNTVTLTVFVPAVTPVTSPPQPIVQATTVHTGEPWAGSRPLELAMLLAGMGMLIAGELLRRRRRAAWATERS